LIGKCVVVGSILVSSLVVTLAAGCGGLVDQVDTVNTYATDAAVQAPPTGELAIGSACADDGDCQGSDPSSRLTCMEIHSGIPFPFGYCTETCQADSDCPGSSFCGVSPYDLGQLARCMTTCTSAAQCRTDYTCLMVEDISQAPAEGCWTAPSR
jgi:hypothetical protein